MLALAGCDYCGNPTAAPNAAELVGIWRPTEKTVDRIAAEGYEAANLKVVVNEDASLEIYGMPQYWSSEGQDKQENILGTWGVYNLDDGRYLLDIHVETVNGKKRGSFYMGCSICQSGNDLTLRFVPHPDLNQDIVFEK